MNLAYRGSVNSWECDENDHLNVRFHIEKHWQTLSGGLTMLALSPQTDVQTLHRHLTVQHVRFLREARLAAPLSGTVGVVGATAEYVDVLTQLRQSFTDELMSSCVHRLTGFAGHADNALPDDAAPRGIEDVDLPHAQLALAAAREHGFQTIGFGVINTAECLPGGELGVHNYMARLSDSMPHLWGQLHAQRGVIDEDEGGAVLEYRLRYHRPLRVGEGYEITSGIRAVGAKVQRFAHLMFNSADGELCVSSEAIGVRMDLRARAAKVLSDEMRRHMRARMIKPFSTG